MLRGQINEIKHNLLTNVELFSVLCCIRNMPKAVVFGVCKMYEILNP